MRAKTKILNSTITLIAVFLLVPFLLQGCTENQEEIEKKILIYDPGFQDKLDERDSLRSDLAVEKMSFLDKEQKLNDQISDMKKLKAKLSAEHADQARKIKDELQPRKQQMKEALLLMKRRFALEKEKIKQVDNDINEVNELISKKDVLALTQEEIKTWEDRLTGLIKKKEGILTETDKMKKEIEINQMKIKVMTI